MPRTHIWIIAATIVSIVDAAGKWWAITSLPHENDVAYRTMVTLALHKNPGIAFDIPIPFLVVAPLTIVIIIGLTVFARREWSFRPMHSAAAITIIAGALNNLIDRAVNGFTTDYIILFATSAINLSDILILAGAFALLRYTKDNPNARTS